MFASETFADAAPMVSNGQPLMRSLDRQQGAVNDGLVALLVKAQARNLGEEVVQPCARARVAVRACYSDVLLGVYRVLASQGLQPF